MSLQKLMKNLMVVIFIAIIAFFSFAQYKTVNNILEIGSQIKAPYISIIVYIVSIVVLISLFFVLKGILRAKDTSKKKIKIFEMLYLLLTFIIVRGTFGALFLNRKIQLNELMTMNKELISLDVFANFLIAPLIKLIDKIFNFPMLSVYIFNTVLFGLATIIVANILKNITKSNLAVNLGVFMYILVPKFMYESLKINVDIVSTLLILVSLNILFYILDEIKIIHGKSIKYLVLSVVLGYVFALFTYTVSYTFVWIIALILIGLIIKNIDLVHMKFSKKTLRKLTSVQKAKLYKIEKVYIRKYVLVVVVTLVSLMIGKLLTDTTLSLITRKSFYGYKPKEISSLFGTITEKFAREQMRDINFAIEDKQKQTLNYNIGKSIIDIIDLTSKGKLKEASNLSSSLEKTIKKPDNFKTRIKNDLNKTITIYKNDTNNVKILRDNVVKQNILKEIMILSNIGYKLLFLAILLTEVLHIILRRKKGEKTVIIKIYSIMVILITFIFGSFTMSNITLTTLLILILFSNIIELYKNRQDKVKTLAEAKYNF